MAASDGLSQNEDLDAGEAYEEKHVHEVYQQIAQHFSSTRYKACPPLQSEHANCGYGRQSLLLNFHP
jgi:hypothetical protein